MKYELNLKFSITVGFGTKFENEFRSSNVPGKLVSESDGVITKATITATRWDEGWTYHDWYVTIVITTISHDAIVRKHTSNKITRWIGKKVTSPSSIGADIRDKLYRQIASRADYFAISKTENVSVKLISK
jgi:hypothetical protein